MRITSWNCNASPSITSAVTAARIYQAKVQGLAALGSDITVFQEMPNPCIPNNPHAVWSGVRMSRGIAVRTSAAYTVALLPDLPPSRSLLPLQINGPTEFLLLAVCSCPERPSPRTYVEEVATSIARCRAHMALLPTVIVGDFNSNSQFDSVTGQHNHAALVQQLADRDGLRSCYHHFTGASQGNEPDATYYHYRHADKPFHIDYCFAPIAWRIEHVTIGRHADWASQSDHCPLTVDLGVPSDDHDHEMRSFTHDSDRPIA
ncbi:MAG: hypothetical protein SH847_27510 [Roseiflexaceae bacterium]|nr:hypothetical protein [Roseiflexaceae bacterium]